MSKQAVFTMKLEAELRDAFMAEAEAAHQPASQVVRELMRGYVKSRQEERDYVAFLERKVALAREDIREGRLIPNDDVEAESAVRRAALLRGVAEE